ATVNDGQWHHVAVTWTGTTAANGVELFLDGLAVAIGTALAPITGASSLLFFGGHDTLALPFYQGLLDEVAVYSHALSAAEIATIYSLRGIAKTAGGSTIAGNLIGTRADGTTPLGNDGDGVRLVDASFNTVGDTTPGDGNTIAFNSGAGVAVT